MALGDDKPLTTGQWAKIVDPGGVTIADAGTDVRILDPGDIDRPTRRKAVMPSDAKLLRISLAYPTGLTFISPATEVIDPVIQVFGFDGSANAVPQALLSMCGFHEITLKRLPDADMLEDGMQFTFARGDEHTIDCDDCAKVLIGIKTPLQADAFAEQAYIRVKAIR